MYYVPVRAGCVHTDYRFNTPPPVETSQPDNNNTLICLTKSNSPLAGRCIIQSTRAFD